MHTPKSFKPYHERNFPCDEDGANCSPTTDHHPEDHFYVDPSLFYDGVTSTTTTTTANH